MSWAEHVRWEDRLPYPTISSGGHSSLLSGSGTPDSVSPGFVSYGSVTSGVGSLWNGDLNVGSYGGWNSCLLSMKILWLHARRAGLAY